MADLTSKERLQPCLLDRLTDEEPTTAVEGRDKRIVSISRYREAVKRDLIWLLNTGRHPPGDGLEDFEEAFSSVINFGIPDMCGSTGSSVSAEDLARQVQQAVLQFEPRIIPRTLSVTAVGGRERTEHNGLAFQIEGELWALPMPEHLLVETAMDLETGRCEMKDRRNG